MKFVMKFVMWYLHRQYKKHKQPIYYIKGYDKDYPKYLLYTENERVYKRMDEF